MPSIKKLIYRPLMLLLSLFLFSNAYAVDSTYTNVFGSAIGGYDPVAYFKAGKPVKGNNDYSFKWNDAKWYFSSEKNKNAFVSAPEKYAPQYGGYCAWAVKSGYAVKTNPDAWSIVNGKLYLNYDKQVRNQWAVDPETNIRIADQKWPSILAQ